MPPKGHFINMTKSLDWLSVLFNFVLVSFTYFGPIGACNRHSAVGKHFNK
jgi:hypothetical protein